MIYQSYEESYEQHTLAATFMPWKFTVIGKEGGQVEIHVQGHYISGHPLSSLWMTMKD